MSGVPPEATRPPAPPQLAAVIPASFSEQTADQSTISRSVLLRRDESVIAAAVRVQRHPLRMLVRHFTRGAAIFRASLRASRSPSFTAIAEQIGLLSPKQKLILVSLPYALALAIALLLLIGREPAVAIPAHAASPAPAAAAVAPAVPAAAPAPMAPAAAREQVSPEDAEPAPIAAPRFAASTEQVLLRRANLYPAPEKRSPLARLQAGATVVTFPGVPAPEGWIVARRPGKEIGFIATRAFDPPEPKRAEAPKKRAKRAAKPAARRTGRTFEAPWPK